MSNERTPSELPPAAAFRPGELVDYGPGAIVSRSLVKQKGGNVTLFAFDAGQELSEHTSPFDALVQVIDGELTLTIGGTPVLARTGDLVLMPADVPHGLRASSRAKMLLTMIR
ncbi:MAG: cupin domain-containing protein [Deltaproteobacteria bacterium]|nr:cupin domain-containing protein [Deltaproteobacteria bacterium]MBW2253742.1 cupin domain-containing protein [Deltaproteobacteria bacterium]